MKQDSRLETARAPLDLTAALPPAQRAPGAAPRLSSEGRAAPHPTNTKRPSVAHACDWDHSSVSWLASGQCRRWAPPSTAEGWGRGKSRAYAFELLFCKNVLRATTRLPRRSPGPTLTMSGLEGPPPRCAQGRQPSRAHPGDCVGVFT